MEPIERLKARKRAASKSSSALIRSKFRPSPYPLFHRAPCARPAPGGERELLLKERQLALRVEVVHGPRVQAEADLVAGLDGHAWIDAGGDPVAAALAVQELVRAEPLDHVDLHVHGGAAVDDAIGDCFRPEPKRALGRVDRLG